MPELIQAVHDKVRNFVRNSEQFKRVCESTFDSVDYRSAGRVSLDEAASCVEALFGELERACKEYGIVLDPLTSDNVRAIFRECDYDSNATLDRVEFQVRSRHAGGHCGVGPGQSGGAAAARGGPHRITLARPPTHTHCGAIPRYCGRVRH
ncbi:hypothetical protein Vretimale_3804 [Volvox reticuliferus]|uniref:EF-hand domain-containing protein n=1 Tax=Volvox reticuliferus TaxID=1737510 RepID=A0A8J4D9N8_9CHLO|nr:hypothetical protein Vretifemale_1463 [Volvox reticuliferus]GIL98478.1 hypothetical protein Vretimale_3804 [Volvox reticuliferus]